MKGLASLHRRKLSRKALLQAALRDCGVSQAEIARETGVSEPTVSRVIAGTQGHPLVELVIADKLGVTREELFPSRAA
jgi:lambda repressor-like predicted transcriptional regulator